MNRLIVSVALLMASSANAAQLSTCLDKIQSKCGFREAFSALVQLTRLDNNQDCRLVQGEASTVTFVDSDNIISTDLKSCNVNAAKTYGQILDSRELAGRLLIVTSQKRVIVVGQNACIYELLSTSNEPYEKATGLRDTTNKNGEPAVKIEGTSAEITAADLQKRIDNYYKGSGKGKGTLSLISCQ